MAIYGIKDNKALEEPIKVIQETIQTGVDYVAQKITLPKGWTPQSCIILNMFAFNQRGNSFSPILGDYIQNDDGTFTVSYKNTGNASIGFIVLVKR